jgi:type II secretory pathway component PulF
MVGVGEKTGELENMLGNIADNYEELSENKLKTLTGLLGPLMIILMAAIVGFVVIAILQPIFQMNQFA